MAEILSNKKVGTDYYYMEFKDSTINEKWSPGEFLHLKVSAEKSYDPLLRRPLSLFDVKLEEKIAGLLYCVVGRGTRILTQFEPGYEIDYIGPLGQGFSLKRNKKILIIGGGMGIAPLYYLTRKLVKKNNKIKILLGGNIETDINFFEKKFKNLNLDIDISLMDGSRGYKGTVIDLWQNKYKGFKPEFIYSCGPEIMLKGIQKIAIKEDIPGEISLEERMGCGVGICLSCVCSTTDGHQRVCKEGPVFSLKEVVFNE